MKKEKKIAILLGVFFFITLATGTAMILLFDGTTTGKNILDIGGTVAGVSQIIFGVILFKAVNKACLKALASFVIIMGLAMTVVHVFGMLSL